MSKVRVAIAVIKNKQGQVLISKRKNGVHKEGYWEFPGGKLEDGENASTALVRELKEELKLAITESLPLINVSFKYPELEVQLYVRVVEDFFRYAIGAEGQEIKWVDVGRLKDYSFPEANHAILKAIQLPREYAIINSSNIKDVLLQLNNVATQGVELVQIRAKDLSKESSVQFLRLLDKECAHLQIEYLLNSEQGAYVEWAGGVHLTSVQLMTLVCKPSCNGYVSASCHNIEELKQAEQFDLDFVVLSPIKETQSHPGAQILGWSQFESLISQVNIPGYALGGVNKNDFYQAVNCGGQGIAGISLFK
jgi:8-oxo-dGTP diphosphatase